MLYLKRKIDLFLAAWKEKPDRNPLIVKGPRQVGKTESIRRFGNRNYKSVIYINFIEEPKYKIIMGEEIKAKKITDIKDIVAEENNVTIEVYIFGIEEFVSSKSNVKILILKVIQL